MVYRYLVRAFALTIGAVGGLLVLGGAANAQSFTPPESPRLGQNLQGVLEDLRSETGSGSVADIARQIRAQLPAPPVQLPPVDLPNVPDLPSQAAPAEAVAPAQTQGGNVSNDDTATSGPAISGNIGLFFGPIGIGPDGLSLGGQRNSATSGAASAGSQIFGPTGTSPLLGSFFPFGSLLGGTSPVFGSPFGGTSPVIGSPFGGTSPFGPGLAPTQFGGFGGLLGFGGQQQQQNTSNGATAVSGPAVAFNAGLFIGGGGLLGGLLGGGGASQVAFGESGPAYAGSQVTTGSGALGFGGLGFLF